MNARMAASAATTAGDTTAGDTTAAGTTAALVTRGNGRAAPTMQCRSTGWACTRAGKGRVAATGHVPGVLTGSLTPGAEVTGAAGSGRMSTSAGISRGSSRRCPSATRPTGGAACPITTGRASTTTGALTMTSMW